MSDRSGDGSLPNRQPAPRASDADRTAVVERLRTAAGDGVIDLRELEERLEAAWSARTLPELAPLTADLPEVRDARSADRSAPSPTDDPGFRMHLTVYLLVIGMLVVIWAAAGGGRPFWPLFPAAGWGVGLGVHWQLARIAVDRRSRPRRDRTTGPAGIPVSAPGIPAIAGTAPAGDIPERRFVVAMFVDVVSSTSLNETVGDEQWAAIRRAFREQVRDCAGANGGWEANTSGDGVLVRFHDPAAAADAAVELLRSLERRRDETGFAPSVRIGIHSGDAVEEGDDIIGNVVNLAARVTDAADVDEVLVTEHVADHLDGRHTTAGQGLHTLKGIGRPRHLLALVWR